MNEQLLAAARRVAVGQMSGTEWTAALAAAFPEDDRRQLNLAAALAADAAREAAISAAALERKTVYAALIAAGHSEKSARRHAREAYNEMLLDAAYAARCAVKAAS